ncbi:DoxX family protein [Tahibacter caeni]|uniref:DoxX family protein n=1 Tax=Tahibacter caeni TaxID=1453545 RepID=UPI002147473F|nr:DoxX family protein [Tahibacter caeni]
MQSLETLFAKAFWYPLARWALAAVFLYSGIDKLAHVDAAVAEVAGFGFRPAGLLAAITIASQLLGAGLLIAGGRAAIAGALLLAGFTAAVTVLVHQFWLSSGVDQVRTASTFLEHVGLVGGFLLIAHHQAKLCRGASAA